MKTLASFFTNLKKYFSRLFGHDPSALSFAWRRDWSIIIVAFFAAIVMVGGAHFLIFKDLTKIVVQPPGPDRSIVNEKKLRDTVTFINERAAQFERIRATRPAVVDPSS